LSGGIAVADVIEVKDLTKKFGDLTAADKISFSVRHGEIFGLLGPNGAGKSTAISMLCTITKPTAGTAIIDGYDVCRHPGRVRRSIGIVFQDPSVDDRLTGRENMRIHANLYGVPLSVSSFVASVPVMMLITFGVVCVGLTIASFLDSLESFGLIQTFVNLPLFFLSGALFPVAHIPSWLQWVFYANPLTYGVDALRSIILGSVWTPLLPLYQEILILLVFDVVFIMIGTIAFSRRS
jgi:ABC-type Fe3+/spermidine/putrescine transport system ATPase subunit